MRAFSFFRVAGVIACMALAPAVLAQGPAPGRAQPQQPIVKPPFDAAALLAEFRPLAGDKDAVIAKFREKIAALSGKGDLLEIQAGIDQVTQVAIDTLKLLAMQNAAVDADPQIPEGGLGFDFGPADIGAPETFAKITASDEKLSGERMEEVRRPGKSVLASDGILGVTGLRFPTPPGFFRMTILTENAREFGGSDQPLGDQIEVNGTSREIANPPAAAWRQGVTFGALPLPEGATPPEVEPTGLGLLAVEAESGPDGIEIKFPANGPRTFIAAIIFEPIPFLTDPEALLAEEIAAALANVVTAAGEPVTLAGLPPIPAFEPTTTVSPN